MMSGLPDPHVGGGRWGTGDPVGDAGDVPHDTRGPPLQVNSVKGQHDSTGVGRIGPDRYAPGRGRTRDSMERAGARDGFDGPAHTVDDGDNECASGATHAQATGSQSEQWTGVRL